MTTVYVVNQSCHNFSQAKKFGKIIFMTKGSIDRFNLTKMHRTFHSFLENSKEGDYIVLSGLTNMSTIACSIFTNKHRRLNLLVWDSKNKRYFSESLFFEGYVF